MSDERLRTIVEKGANVVGTTAGAALGFITGSPETTLLATAVGASDTYRRVGVEVSNVILGPREQVRVGGVIALSAEILKEKLKEGYTLRDDDFFDSKPTGRPDADEILEGVLRKAQLEYEERKLPYLARFWSNACINKHLTVEKLNYLLKVLENLTYRQFVIIAIVGLMAKNNYKNAFGLRKNNYEHSDLTTDSETADILSEVMALHNYNCIELIAPLGLVQITPSEIKLGSRGIELYNIMELHRISNIDECMHVAKLLQ